jgi:hypothetical protein
VAVSVFFDGYYEPDELVRRPGWIQTSAGIPLGQELRSPVMSGLEEKSMNDKLAISTTADDITLAKVRNR